MTPTKTETTHVCPPGDSGIMPCCGLTPFDVPLSDRLVVDRAEATCTGLTGDCETDCHAACAYPGQFGECSE